MERSTQFGIPLFEWQSRAPEHSADAARYCLPEEPRGPVENRGKSGALCSAAAPSPLPVVSRGRIVVARVHRAGLALVVPLVLALTHTRVIRMPAAAAATLGVQLVLGWSVHVLAIRCIAVCSRPFFKWIGFGTDDGSPTS